QQRKNADGISLNSRRLSHRRKRDDGAWWTELQSQALAGQSVDDAVQFHGFALFQHIAAERHPVSVPRLLHGQSLNGSVDQMRPGRGVPSGIATQRLTVKEPVVFPGPLPILHDELGPALPGIPAASNIRQRTSPVPDGTIPKENESVRVLGQRQV